MQCDCGVECRVHRRIQVSMCMHRGMEGRRHQPAKNACPRHVSPHFWAVGPWCSLSLRSVVQLHARELRAKHRSRCVPCYCVCTVPWNRFNRFRSAVMAIALAVLSCSFWYYDEKPPPFVAIGAMAIIAGAYSFSYGPLNWLITAELFTVGVRGIVVHTF